MKAVALVLAGFVLVAGAFVALAGWLVVRDGSQSALTERVQVTVIAPHESRDSTLGRGFAFDYAYEKDGRWYGSEDWVAEEYWSPGQPLTACIDPTSPRQHVLTLRQERCGQKVIVGDNIADADPRPAPEQG